MAAKPFKQELLNYPWPPSSAIKAHGKRWLDACEANRNQQEEVWQRVSRAIPDLSPREFIKFVIRARSRAGGLPAFLAQDSREPTAEEIKKRIKRALNSKKRPRTSPICSKRRHSQSEIGRRLLKSTLKDCLQTSSAEKPTSSQPLISARSTPWCRRAASMRRRNSSRSSSMLMTRTLPRLKTCWPASGRAVASDMY